MRCAQICPHKKAQNIDIFETQTFKYVLWCYNHSLRPIWVWFDTTHVYHIKHSIWGPCEVCGCGCGKIIKKTHTCGAGVCGVKSYCAQSVWVCQNWLHTNTLENIKGSIVKVAFSFWSHWTIDFTWTTFGLKFFPKFEFLLCGTNLYRKKVIIVTFCIFIHHKSTFCTMKISP